MIRCKCTKVDDPLQSAKGSFCVMNNTFSVVSIYDILYPTRFSILTLKVRLAGMKLILTAHVRPVERSKFVAPAAVAYTTIARRLPYDNFGATVVKRR